MAAITRHGEMATTPLDLRGSARGCGAGRQDRARGSASGSRIAPDVSAPAMQEVCGTPSGCEVGGTLGSGESGKGYGPKVCTG